MKVLCEETVPCFQTLVGGECQRLLNKTTARQNEGTLMTVIGKTIQSYDEDNDEVGRDRLPRVVVVGNITLIILNNSTNSNQ